MRNVCLAFHSMLNMWGGLETAFTVKDPSQNINWVTPEGEASPTLAWNRNYLTQSHALCMNLTITSSNCEDTCIEFMW